MIDLLILIFTYLPSIFVHIVVCVGLGSFIFSFFMGDIVQGLVPTVYKSVIKYGGIFLLVLGLFLEGGLAVNNEYLDRAKEWNHKIEIAEIRANEATSKIEYIVKDRIVEVEKKQLVYRDRIIKRSTDIDKVCIIDTDTITILNDAARK